MTIVSAIGSVVSSSYLDSATSHSAVFHSAVSHSMVAWEMAGSAAQSQKLMNAWGAEGKSLASFCLGFDFFLIAAYVTSIGLACLWARDGFEERGWPLAGLGLILSVAMVAAGLFDGIENYALLQQLLHGPDDSCAYVARVFAILKFGIVVPALIFSAIGSIAQEKPIVGLILGVITALVIRPVWTNF